MSVLIKGVKMPINCRVCFLRDDCDMSMPFIKRPFDCPMVEIPEGATVKITYEEEAVLELVN